MNQRAGGSCDSETENGLQQIIYDFEKDFSGILSEATKKT